jgi:hypothetical protein
MADPKRPELPILTLLKRAYAKYRRKVKPLFPYDAKTNMGRLPPSVEDDMRRLVSTGRLVEAVKRVTELTGAGLRVSKDYVDNLVRKR